MKEMNFNMEERRKKIIQEINEKKLKEIKVVQLVGLRYSRHSEKWKMDCSCKFRL